MNERAQIELRKELVRLFKANIPDWEGFLEEIALPKINEKSRENEKVVLAEVITNPEQQAIFDVEIPHKE